MKVELPDDVVKFLKELATEIKAQDNRATASPYFYIVKGLTQLVAPPGYGEGDSYYYSREREAAHTKDEWIPILKEHDEENGTSTDIDAFIVDCEEFGMHSVDVEENVFLTFKGYKEHMDLNGHNYRHLKDVHSFVKYAWRNPEMTALLKAIMAFADMP